MPRAVCLFFFFEFTWGKGSFMLPCDNGRRSVGCILQLARKPSASTDIFHQSRHRFFNARWDRNPWASKSPWQQQRGFEDPRRIRREQNPPAEIFPGPSPRVISYPITQLRLSRQEANLFFWNVINGRSTSISCSMLLARIASQI